MKIEHILKAKIHVFAIHATKLFQFLQAGQKELMLSKHLLRSGTSTIINNQNKECSCRMIFLSFRFYSCMFHCITDHR